MLLLFSVIPSMDNLKLGKRGGDAIIFSRRLSKTMGDITIDLQLARDDKLVV